MRSFYPVEQVESVFILAEEGYNKPQIGRELGVTQPCISYILSGKRWSNHPASIEYRSKKSVV